LLQAEGIWAEEPKELIFFYSFPSAFSLLIKGFYGLLKFGGQKTPTAVIMQQYKTGKQAKIMYSRDGYVH
jgi:hypothetical protein